MGAIIPFVISTVAGAVMNKALNRKTSPAPAAAPVSPPPSAADTLKTAVPAAMAAAVQQKKKALGAQGRQSTILTGPSGLGTMGPSGADHKTILGF